jgi:TPR repeat protein
VAYDLMAGMHWYQRAAERDRTNATFALGEIYLGWGPVVRDDKQAEAYFREALQHGHPDAQAAIDLLQEPEITLELKRRRWKFWNPRGPSPT